MKYYSPAAVWTIAITGVITLILIYFAWVSVFSKVIEIGFTSTSDTTVVEVDTIEVDTVPWVIERIKHYSKMYEIPDSLLMEMKSNESGWLYPDDSTYICPPIFVRGENSFGDLQMVYKYYPAWAEQLGLGDTTRDNLLHTCTAYLRYQYDRYGSWEKARFAYGRGHYRGKHTWTSKERAFMQKIDWSKYDG